MIEVLYGDCTEEHIWIEDGAVDLIASDLPYGTVKGMTLKGQDQDTHSWDEAIDPDKVFAIANRVLRKGGRALFFCQEPYTSALMRAAPANLIFNYRLIWVKDSFGNNLLVNKAPAGYYEDILVFTKRHDLLKLHPLRAYFSQVFQYIGGTKREILNRIGGRAQHVFSFDTTQFSLCTRETYELLTESYFLECLEGFKTYDELLPEEVSFREKYAQVFNLWEGKAHKSNVLYYPKDPKSKHPTQKPLALMQDLVQTFSNKGDLVVDLTAGYGTTAVACETTGRNAIIIEKALNWYQAILERLKNI